MQREIAYGHHRIAFTVTPRARKILEIAVEPDGQVLVAAPRDAAPEAIDDKVRQRAAWILRQQRYFDQFRPRTPERLYIVGETHLYLGRQYRLKVVPHIQSDVKLIRGFIVVQTHYPRRPETTRDLVETWFRERLELCLERFPDPEVFRPTGLIVRQLAQRWAPCPLPVACC